MIKPKYIEKNLDQKFLIKSFRLFFYFFFPLSFVDVLFFILLRQISTNAKRLKDFF
jgi:hypothetical protein